MKGHYDESHASEDLRMDDAESLSADVHVR